MATRYKRDTGELQRKSKDTKNVQNLGLFPTKTPVREDGHQKAVKAEKHTQEA